MLSVNVTEFVREYRENLLVVIQGRHEIVEHYDRPIGQREGIGAQLRRMPEH